MPTRNPRLQLTITEAQDDLLRRLAKLQQRSRASVVMEILETVEPVLERVAVASEAAARARETARTGLRESMERAESDMRPHVERSLAQLDIFLGSVEAQAGSSPGGALSVAEDALELVYTPSGGAGRARRGGTTVPRPAGAVEPGKRGRSAPRTPVPVTTGVRSAGPRGSRKHGQAVSKGRKSRKRR